MLRRLAIVAVLPFVLVSCKKGAGSLFAPRAASSPDDRVVRRGTVDPVTGRYIPPVCVADGSYQQALDCFRQADVLRFRIADGTGSLTRNEEGEIRLMLYIAKGELRGAWYVVRDKKGIIWSRNRVRLATVPPVIHKIFLLTSRFPDPEKKEGGAKAVHRDSESITYAFTDAKNGDRYVVKVDPKTGHMQEVTAGEITLTFRTRRAAAAPTPRR